MARTRRTYYVIGDTKHSGVGCTNCGTSYKACSERILVKGLHACCKPCEETDTHDEREVGMVATKAKDLPDKVVLSGIDLYDLRTIVDSLEEVENAATGVGRLVQMTLATEVNGSVIRAEYADGKWDLSISKDQS